MRISKLMLVAVAALFIGGAAGAATVKVRFDGVIVGLIGFDKSTSSLGDKFTAEISFSESQVGKIYSPLVGNGWVYEFIDGSIANPTVGFGSNLDSPPVHTGLYFEALTPEERQRGAILVNGGPNTNGSYNISGTAESENVKFVTHGSTGVTGSIPSPAIRSLRDVLQTPNIFVVKRASLHVVGSTLWGTCSLTSCIVGASIEDVTVEITPVSPIPVPTALPLMVLGLAGLGFAGRRRGRID